MVQEVAALSSLAGEGPVLGLRQAPVVFQVLKSFKVETKEQSDVPMAYRFVLVPSPSPLFTFRPAS